MTSIRSLAGAIVLALLAASCNQSGDYLAVAGGGFMFNYRIAEASYGIALKPMRELPADGIIEASFENPAGGAPIIDEQGRAVQPDAHRLRHAAGHGGGEEAPLQGHRRAEGRRRSRRCRRSRRALRRTSTSRCCRSKPLAIGPGYQKNVDGSDDRLPAVDRLRPAGAAAEVNSSGAEANQDRISLVGSPES